MGLARAKTGAVILWGFAGKLFKSSGEMALIEKATRKGDFAKRRVSLSKLFTGKFDAQPAHVIADCAVIKPAKLARQMNRMNTDTLRLLTERQAFCETFV